MNFEKTINDLITWQDTVLGGLKKLEESKNLKKLLGAVLAFGNCLNAGNKNRG